VPLAIASAAKTVVGILKPVTRAKRAEVRRFFIILSAYYFIFAFLTLRFAVFLLPRILILLL